MISLDPTLPPVPAIDASQTTSARKLEWPSELPPPEPQGQCERSRLATCSVSQRPGDRGVWSIGDPANPSPDDAVCGSEESARKCAAQMSEKYVVAVWSGEDCIALYFEGRAWRRA